MNPASHFNKHAIKIGFLSLIVLFIFSLVGCATAPKQNNTGNEATLKEQEQTPVSVFAQIAAKYSAENNTISGFPDTQHKDRNAELLELANKNVDEDDCLSANIIIKFIDSSIIDGTNRAKANLFKIECELRALGQSSSQLNEVKNRQILALLETWSNASKPNLLENELAARFAISNANIAVLNNDFEEALVTLLRQAESLIFLGPQRANDLIWQWYSLLPKADKRALVKRFPRLVNFATVFNMVADATINDSIRQASIKLWLQQNQGSQLARQLPQQLTRYLALDSVKQQKIAVLLPLSGRLSSQGEAIKQGILAAYLQRVDQASANTNQPTTEIEFIDTRSVSAMPVAINTERLAAFDIIIGPLLKSHIEQIQALTLPSIKQVALNQSQITQQQNITESTIANQSITAFFALSPEQEAQQLVLLMRKQNISNPVLIKDSSSMANRIALAFNKAWEQTATSLPKQSKPANSDNQVANKRVVQPIQEITYTNNKSMRVGITSALDVLQSQRRIQQLSNLNQERIYSVTRNRRDVDAFVVFSRPDELELINPIIETSISLFTNKQLPVFASSYSYDHKQSKNSQRDLRNLIFIDMPWLISNTREDELSNQVDKLFNRPPSTFLRLFAFGFDALAIADNLAQLSTFDYMTINGLTGTLSLTSNNMLNRELAWLAITESNN